MKIRYKRIVVFLMVLVMLIPSIGMAINIDNGEYVRVALSNSGEHFYVQTKNIFKLYEFDPVRNTIITLKEIPLNQIELQIEDNQLVLLSGWDKETYPQTDKIILLSTQDGFFTFNNKTYRGYITLNNQDGKTRAVNYVKIRHYLYGVVPSEMPSSWSIEALKAQAVAARTFAKKEMVTNIKKGFDVYDTTSSQVYKGFSGEKKESNRAVDETHGIYMKYDNTYINAVYHSNSGGYTESSENIWNYKVPYLRGKKDDYSLNAPNSTWVYKVSYDQLNKILNANIPNLGDVTALAVVEKTENYRNVKIKVTGTKQEKILDREALRKYLGYTNLKSIWYDIDFGGGKMVVLDTTTNKTVSTATSTNYGVDKDGNVSPVVTPTNVMGKDGQEVLQGGNGEVVFTGHGYGHGVGMSQWGAKGMSDQGFRYDEILKFYYEGITLVKEGN